jgi:large-conductance mechanosensitive channel
VRFAWLAVALFISVPVVAQVEKKAVTKKQAAAKKKKAHQKPTPEQIRKFNELQKKQ